ncbi:MAG: hypothetical protein GTO41_28020 [Burkholderiales bacterium]|nr:hypothetical protein [Burkholderiales bacterium]
MRDLDVEPGDDFSFAELHRDLQRLYGRGDFSYLGYSVVGGTDNGVVLLDAETKPWGPGYLKFGFGVRSDFDSPTQGNLAASYRRTWANALGAEWRIDAQIGYHSLLSTEFLAPLQVRDGAFVAPYAIAQRTNIQIYDDDIRLGQLRTNSVGGGLDFGLTGTVGEVRIGPYAEGVRSQPDLGALTSILSPEEATMAGFRALAVADQLDSVSFPRAGWYAGLSFENVDEDWGSDYEYQVAHVKALGVKSFGKHTFSILAEWGEEISGLLPPYELFELGGPARLSGLFLDQLTGTRYNLGVITYYRRYGNMPTQLGRGLYAGVSIEAGRINDPFMKDPWGWISAGSIYWAADTILGTLMIGYGYSSLGQGSAYLTIGQHF